MRSYYTENEENRATYVRTYAWMRWIYVLVFIMVQLIASMKSPCTHSVRCKDYIHMFYLSDTNHTLHTSGGPSDDA